MSFIVTFILSLILVPIVSKVTKNLGIIAHTNKQTIHKGVIARTGGYAIYVSFLIGAMIFLKTDIKINSILIGGFIIFLTGFYDDIHDISPKLKMLGQIIAALVVIFYGGISLKGFTLPFLPDTVSYIIAIIITIAWIVGITNAVNLINEKFDIQLPKDEATSIAFHLITATENKSNHQALVIMQGVSDIIKIVEKHLGSQLNEDTFIYSRFVIHLKFFLGSILSNQIENINLELNSIFVRLNTKYKEVRICIQEITKYVLEHFHYHCRDEDCIYLMIHIVRLYERKGYKED